MTHAAPADAQAEAVAEAVRYATRNGIDGAVVMCGASSGATAAAAAEALVEAHEDERELYLFDAAEDAAERVAAGSFPGERLHAVDGDVSETLPAGAPGRIAVLWLEASWYEPTKHELEQLVWRVSPLGILILGGYGAWPGGRRAVDEFLESFDRPVFLVRLDDAGRLAVVP